MQVLFKPFPKLSRWSRDVVITEKLDGTNACIIIERDSDPTQDFDRVIGVQSRNKVITPDDDNYGFAGWVDRNAQFLADSLGAGYHYGEWWGNGIQRGYGLKRKQFSLFNTHRWNQQFSTWHADDIIKAADIGLDVVPVLWQGNMDEAHIRLQLVMQELERTGSVAAPGFMNPEGIVLFHSAGGYLFKKTFEKDQEGKGNA